MADLPIPKLDDYKFGCKIGSGSFADVYKVTKCNSQHEVFAVKCVQKCQLSKASSNNLINEIKLLKAIDHKHIVKLQDFAWDDNYIYLIMEYCSGGDLSHYIKFHKRLSENICQRFLQQLAISLQFLRSRNISHFDLKPQNIFLATKQLHILKIGDFGLAQHMSDSDTNTYIKGSPLYMAPEIVIHRKYDVKADIWSVGVILYECLFGKAPYASPTIEELLLKIKTGKPIKIPHNFSISSKCRDFLAKCLQKNPQNRMDFEMFFNHPFIDMIHAPSENSLDLADDCIAIATALESEGKMNEAYDHYNDALRYLTPVMYTELNKEKRENLRKTILNYVSHLETIKSPSGSPKGISILESSKPFKNEGYESTTNELVQLSKSTPNMNTAIEIAQTADLYLKEQNYEIALENYKMALGKLLDLIGSEPPGRRKKLLIAETKRWMNCAEYIKKCLHSKSTANKDFPELLEAEAEKSCMLQ